MHRIKDTTGNATHTDDNTPILFHALNGSSRKIIAVRSLYPPRDYRVGGATYTHFSYSEGHDWDIYVLDGGEG